MRTRILVALAVFAAAGLLASAPGRGWLEPPWLYTVQSIDPVCPESWFAASQFGPARFGAPLDLALRPDGWDFGDASSRSAVLDAFVQLSGLRNEQQCRAWGDPVLEHPLDILTFYADSKTYARTTPGAGPASLTSQQQQPAADEAGAVGPGTPPFQEPGWVFAGSVSGSERLTVRWKFDTWLVQAYYLAVFALLALGLARRVLHEKTAARGLLLFSLPVHPRWLFARKAAATLAAGLVLTVPAAWLSSGGGGMPWACAGLLLLLGGLFAGAALLSAVLARNRRESSLYGLLAVGWLAYGQLFPEALLPADRAKALSLLAVLADPGGTWGAGAWRMTGTCALAALLALAAALWMVNGEDFFDSRPPLEKLCRRVGRGLRTRVWLWLLLPGCLVPACAFMLLQVHGFARTLQTGVAWLPSAVLLGAVLCVEELERMFLPYCLRVARPRPGWLGVALGAAVFAAAFACVRGWCLLELGRGFSPLGAGAMPVDLRGAVAGSVALVWAGLLAGAWGKPRFWVPVLVGLGLRVAALAWLPAGFF